MTEPAARGRSRWFDGAAAGCYALWGTIHVLVGSTVLSKAAGPQPHEALRFLADAHPETSPPHFAPATTALAKQHGWNLLWIGGAVAMLAWPIIRQRPRASAWAFAVAGLADLGYLGAFVIPGFVRPSTWIAGPTLWLAGGLFSAIAARNRRPA